ncbi:hypothetical protein B0O80DRAFT_189329 [Mortierella sp. GBAus27b]|nr:hypothetical protein B0O80DRAFT_189329 [Mortierella sp. GBAus27b]
MYSLIARSCRSGRLILMSSRLAGRSTSTCSARGPICSSLCALCATSAFGGNQHKRGWKCQTPNSNHLCLLSAPLGIHWSWLLDIPFGRSRSPFRARVAAHTPVSSDTG